MMIALTRDHYAEIDFSDWWKVQGHKWFAVARGLTFYAETRIGNRNVGMHTLIKPPPKGCMIDHKDHNGLNNRWYNLRHVTHLENAQHRKASQQSENASGYRGVMLTHAGTYQARIRHEGRNVGLGTYETAEEAARAYDAAATKWHGEYAILNFGEHTDDGRAIQIDKRSQP